MQTRNDRAVWIKAGDANCSHPPARPHRVFRFVAIGAPGIGRGTQAELLCDRLGMCHLSSGDVFRAAQALTEDDRTAAMESALGHMQRGELVPDDTVLALVGERIRCLRCPGGFLLDGFPRTVKQAEALDIFLDREHLALNGVLDYQLPVEQIITRPAGRRTCSQCKAVFHVTARPPQFKDLCDRCGSPLIQREDDQPAAVRVRMEAYLKSADPLEEFYRRKGLLIPVPAEGTPEQVYARTLEILWTESQANSPRSYVNEPEF